MFDFTKVVDVPKDETKKLVGKKVWYSDSLESLAARVDNDILPGTLVETHDGRTGFPFGVIAEHTDHVVGFYRYVYPCKEENEDASCSDPEVSENSQKYRPFKDKKEVIDCVVSTQLEGTETTKPFAWIRNKKTHDMFLITGYCNKGVFADEFISFFDLLEFYTFVDKTPCGVKVC